MNKAMELPMGVDAYDPVDQGFFPVVFFEQWRVAVLNYCDIVEKNLLYRLERHTQTDEVFVLQRGQAWLIIAGSGALPQQPVTFPMEKNTVYNIAQNCWHHVIMTGDASILIVENADTGDTNSEYAELSLESIKALKAQITFG